MGIIYEMVTGMPAYDGINAMEVALAIRNRRHGSLDGLQPAMKRLLQSLWLPPASRPNSLTIPQLVHAMSASDFAVPGRTLRGGGDGGRSSALSSGGEVGG